MHAHIPSSRNKHGLRDRGGNTSCALTLIIVLIHVSLTLFLLSFFSSLEQDIYAPKERGTMMGIYYSAPLLGPSLGPLLGGVLSEVWNWRATFYFLAVVGGIVLLSLFLFNDTYRRERSLTYQAAARHALRRVEEKARKKNKQNPDVEEGGQPTVDTATVSVTIADLNLFTPIWNVLRRKNNLFILFPSGPSCCRFSSLFTHSL